MFIIVKIIYDIGKSFLVNWKIDFDRFCNDSGSDYIQKVHICPKNDRTIQIDHLFQVDLVIYQQSRPIPDNAHQGPFFCNPKWRI